MVKVLLYGYATGVFSSRKIAAKLHEDRTIGDFRAFHLKELSDLFVQVVKLAREMGLVKLGTIAVAQLKKEIDGLLERARRQGRQQLKRRSICGACAACKQPEAAQKAQSPPREPLARLPESLWATFTGRIHGLVAPSWMPGQARHDKFLLPPGLLAKYPQAGLIRPDRRRRRADPRKRYFSALNRMRLGLAPSSPRRLRLSASYSW